MIKMLDLERNTKYIAYNMELCWILRKNWDCNGYYRWGKDAVTKLTWRCTKMD